MLICANCGSTNSEIDGPICRKCGALLPISTKPPRMRVSLQGKKEQSNLAPIPSAGGTPSETKKINFFIPGVTIGKIPQKPEVRKIPPQTKPQVKPLPQVQQKEPSLIPTAMVGENIKKNLEKIPKTINTIAPSQIPSKQPSMASKQSENIQIVQVQDKKYLKEVEPKPFDGTLLSSKEIALNNQIPRITQVNSSKSASKTNSSSTQWKELENDMSHVLKLLSEKMGIQKEEESKPIFPTGIVVERKIPPASLNEILENLLKINKHIEASAVIKTDGTILASAISNRISDALFATIGKNLIMIGTDIINGLVAGLLKTISIRGTEGVLDLAPIDQEHSQVKDMILILFSDSRIKSGVINICKNQVKKQVYDYLGIKGN